MLAITLMLAAALWSRASGSSVLVADMAMSKMVELKTDAPFCALYTDRGVIQKMVLNADPKKVRQMSNNLVADLEETCKESRDKGKNQPAGGGLIYPGTKWCGPGTLASSYDELGHHAAEDACCREHDQCPVTLGPHECIHGICNNSPFTRSHCDCDAKFRRCLQNLNSEVANTLGALFFNVIQVTCFKERRPCSQWQSGNTISCPLEWESLGKFEVPMPRDHYAKKVLIVKTFLQIMREALKQKQRHLLGGAT
ncbi:phospholipase A2 phaiodactylipin isoform X1 [Lasioglossum baleicum]|uniref:phospholipase A2 phaiodactylipin isoform X1 n=1 Tax=Lasioglossum baleicum TaxID=434251 RepID=UPI003FCE5E04